MSASQSDDDRCTDFRSVHDSAPPADFADGSGIGVGPSPGDADAAGPGVDYEVPFGAFDGFRVIQQSGHLFLEFHLAGKPFLENLLVKHFPESQEGEAACERLSNLVSVLAGYMNTGGQVEELEEIVAKLKPIFQTYQIELPEGWRLLNWNYGANPDQYVFINDALGLVSIVEPEEYAETTTVTEFMQGEDIEMPASGLPIDDMQGELDV